MRHSWKQVRRVAATLSACAAALLCAEVGQTARVQLQAPVSNPPPLAAGTPAPPFTTNIVGGGALKSSSLLGHIVLLDFWATWCVTCKADMPRIEKIYRQFGPRGVRVIGISEDTDEAASAGPVARKLGVTFPIAVAPKRNLAAGRDYNANVLPCVYIIDRHGIVRWSYSGDYPADDIRAELDRLLRSDAPHAAHAIHRR